MPLVQLHGLVPQDTAQVALEHAHHILLCGSVNALLSPFPDLIAFENLTPEEVAAWAMRHNAILTAYCRDTPVLPLKVGAVFSNHAAIRAEVARDMPSHLAALEELNDLREYTLRLMVGDGPAAPVPIAATGRDFLAARRQFRLQRTDHGTTQTRFAQDLLNKLNRLCRQIEPAGAPKQGRILDCVMLVPTTQIDDLRTLTAESHASARSAGLDLTVTGPWPPYSYTAPLAHKVPCNEC